MAYVAPTGLWLTPQSTYDPSSFLSSSSYIKAIAQGEVKLSSLQSDVIIESDANSQVNVGTATYPSLLQIGKSGDDVAVDARALELVSGRLLVSDGTITLASRNSSSSVVAASLHGAGTFVGGDGAGGASFTLPTQRSLTWSRGYAELPSSEITSRTMKGARSNVGSWDVRGGGLRFLSQVTNSIEAGYGLRVHSNLDFELYRRDIDNSSNVVYRRIYRMGNKGSSNVSMIPTSPVF